MSVTIQDLPVVDRPRERLHSFGAGSLSLQELLGIILGHGSGKVGSVLNLTKQM